MLLILKNYRCNTIFCSATPVAVCKRTTKIPLDTEGVLFASKTTSFKPFANAWSRTINTLPNKSQTVNFAVLASGKVKDIVVFSCHLLVFQVDFQEAQVNLANLLRHPDKSTFGGQFAEYLSVICLKFCHERFSLFLRKRRIQS